MPALPQLRQGTAPLVKTEAMVGIHATENFPFPSYLQDPCEQCLHTFLLAVIPARLMLNAFLVELFINSIAFLPS